MDSVSCFAASDGALSLISFGCPLEVFYEGALLPTNQSLEGLAAGAYELEIVDSLGCRWDTTAIVDSPPPFAILNLMDTAVYLAECVTLRGIPSFGLVDSAIWTPAIYLNRTDSNVVIAEPLADQVYHLELVNDRGCRADTTVFVQIEKRDKLYLPDIFSPNGDGVNEYFYPQAGRLLKSVKEVLEFVIYDPDEQGVIFQKSKFLPDDPAYGWDGISRGIPINSDTYLYFICWERIDGETFWQVGEIQLIR